MDRAGLDDQLHDQFIAGRSLVGEVKQAGSADELRGAGGEVVFTTIEKVRLQKNAGEAAHPVLSGRSNLFVVADEAHRSQYGFAGTPVTFADSDTVDVFGEVIHTHDIAQSQADGATLAGKSLAACMARRNCVAISDALRALPGRPEVKVVMTGSPAERLLLAVLWQ